MTRALRVIPTLLSAFGASLPTATKDHRGQLVWKRAAGSEDEVYAGVVDSSNVAQFRRLVTNQQVATGSGSPEGVITGTIGSLYLRTDANEGRQLYVKVSGTGNTGWLPVHRANRRRTLRSVVVYEGASLTSSHVESGFQNGPTITADATSNADGTTGAHLQHDTTAASGNTTSVVAGTNSGVRFEWQPDLSLAIRTDGTITSMRSWYGMFASSPAASDDPAIEGCGFRYSTNASDTNWQAWSNDGSGAGTVTDTGVAVAQGSAYDLRMIVDSTASIIDFYIGSTRVARHTTNLPVSTTVLNYGLYVRTLTNAVRSLRWGRVTLESEP